MSESSSSSGAPSPCPQVCAELYGHDYASLCDAVDAVRAEIAELQTANRALRGELGAADARLFGLIRGARVQGVRLDLFNAPALQP